VSISNDSASLYSSTGGFWPPVNRVFRKLGYEIVPTKARLPKEVRQDYDRVLATIGAYTFKFLDVRTFLTATIQNAHRLGLHTSTPLSILDLGTGVGYFPVVCAHYGHSVIAIDRDGNRVFEDVTRWLGVDRRSHEIRAREPLPQMERRFDLITAFMVNFDQFIETDLSPWGVEEWGYFLRDVAANQLLPNGRLVLRLNPHTASKSDILSYFRAEGAEITKDWVEFNALARQSARTLAGVV
jgi:SAM-dependent methyltransferase